MRKTLTEAEVVLALATEVHQGSSCAASALVVVRALSKRHLIEGAIVNTDEEFTLELTCKTRDGESFNLRMDME